LRDPVIVAGNVSQESVLGKGDGIADVLLFGEIGNFRSVIVAADVETDDLDLVRTVFFTKRVQMRHFLDARRAIGRPKIQDQYSAGMVGDALRRSIHRGPFHIGDRLCRDIRLANVVDRDRAIRDRNRRSRVRAAKAEYGCKRDQGQERSIHQNTYSAQPVRRPDAVKILHEFRIRFILQITLTMPVYPKRILGKVEAVASTANIQEGSDAVGVAAALECGTSVRFAIGIIDTDKTISSLGIRSNGCGFMIAAAGIIRDVVVGKDLRTLKGLDSSELLQKIENALGKFPHDRRHCASTVIEALHEAFADYRRRRLEEFSGEQALICTCFGVSEKTIESAITAAGAASVSDIGRLTRAGTGCGSCQLLIQEIIDSREADML